MGGESKSLFGVAVGGLCCWFVFRHDFLMLDGVRRGLLAGCCLNPAGLYMVFITFTG